MIVRLVSSTVSATTSGNNAERVQYSGETGIVRISADEGCHIKIGGDSVSAGQTDYFVGKNYEVFMHIEKDQYISVKRAANDNVQMTATQVVIGG